MGRPNVEIKSQATNAGAFRAICLHNIKKGYIVIKGIHSTTHEYYITNILTTAGNTAINVHTIRRFHDKASINLFYIDLEPSASNEDIFNFRDRGRI